MTVDPSEVERQNLFAPVAVTMFVCPVCLTVGGKNNKCPHYESGSVGMVYYTRLPAVIAALPNGRRPITTSLESVVKERHD
jgi:hypothetical protein